MSAVEEKLLTVDEFWAVYGHSDARYELVKGRPVEMPPPTGEHGSIGGRISGEIYIYLKTHDRGEILIETDFRLEKHLVRRPDVAFAAKARWEQIPDRKKFLPIHPDIAIEVVSPSESAADIHDKTRDYLAAGVRLVWVIYPDRKELVVHYPDGSAQTLTADDTLSGGDVLPGFALPVAQIFP